MEFRNYFEKINTQQSFIKEKTALNANVVADNERYLRSPDYIHDSRIFVDTIANEADSIGLIVVTKDFLSITVELSHATKDRCKSRTGDANIMGTARLSTTGAL